MITLAGMVLAAFLAATPLPMNSELPFIALLGMGYDTGLLILLASIGNILGSCVTYGIGRWAEHFRHKSWFPLSEDHLTRAQGWWQKWGLWSLLLSWIPGGDLMVALAGLMRVNFLTFLVLISISKVLRYLGVALIAQGVLTGVFASS